MQILSDNEIRIIEKHKDLFQEGVSLREITKAVVSEVYPVHILLATAKVLGYPMRVRYYLVKSGRHTLLRIDITAEDSLGEYLIESARTSYSKTIPDQDKPEFVKSTLKMKLNSIINSLIKDAEIIQGRVDYQ